LERNRELQNKVLKMKESTQRVVFFAVVAGGLAWAIGFVVGAILTLPDREKTKVALAAVEAKAERRIEKERKNAQATIASIKAKAEKELNIERDNRKTGRAEIARLEDERDSAIAEVKQVKQKYYEALRKLKEFQDMLVAKAAKNNKRREGEQKGDYHFEEVSIKMQPRFILPDKLAMGNWVYRAYNVYDSDSGRYFAVIDLEIEIIPNLMTLPPIGLNLEVLRGGNKIVGRGMLVPIELKIGEKSRYKGVVIVESFSDIEIIRILKI